MAEKGKSVEEETGQEGWERGSVAKKGVGGKRRVGSISLIFRSCLGASKCKCHIFHSENIVC